jgi:hypothetical protein
MKRNNIQREWAGSSPTQSWWPGNFEKVTPLKEFESWRRTIALIIYWYLVTSFISVHNFHISNIIFRAQAEKDWEFGGLLAIYSCAQDSEAQKFIESPTICCQPQSEHDRSNQNEHPFLCTNDHWTITSAADLRTTWEQSHSEVAEAQRHTYT